MSVPVAYLHVSREDGERLRRLSRLAHQVFWLVAFCPGGVFGGTVRTIVRKLRLRDKRTERATDVTAALRELEDAGLVACAWTIMDGTRELVQVRVLVNVQNGSFEMGGVA